MGCNRFSLPTRISIRCWGGGSFFDRLGTRGSRSSRSKVVAKKISLGSSHFSGLNLNGLVGRDPLAAPATLQTGNKSGFKSFPSPTLRDVPREPWAHTRNLARIFSVVNACFIGNSRPDLNKPILAVLTQLSLTLPNLT